jgi:uncharacterized protein (TIGR02145 family)
MLILFLVFIVSSILGCGYEVYYEHSSSSRQQSSSSLSSEPSSSSLSSSSIQQSSSSLPNESSSSSSLLSSSSFLVTANGSCDIKDYKTTQIGDQIWMAENLNCNVSGSKCYNNDLANCSTYGGLYDWATAMKLPSKCNSILSSIDTDCAIESLHTGICPSGWHIPNIEDWATLKNCVRNNSECSKCAYKHLRAINGWNWNDFDNVSGNGQDTYGFSALPGGYYGNHFYSVGSGGYWWTATEERSDKALSLVMYNWIDDSQSWGVDTKSFLYSVRCLQD